MAKNRMSSESHQASLNGRVAREEDKVKVLIAYYSRRGENYVNGSIKNLKLGNTEVVVGKIKALLPDADVFQIDTTYEYSKDYMTCIEV